MIRWTPLLLLVGLYSSACDRADVAPFHPDTQKLAAQLHTLTETTPTWMVHSDLGRRLWSIEKQFYEGKSHQPAWIDGTHPRSELMELVRTLKDADLHGLDPSRYGADAFSVELDGTRKAIGRPSFDEARVPELDLRLTYAYLTYAGDLLGWSSSPRDIDPDWIASPVKADLAADLRAALRDNQVRRTLDRYAPSHPQYRGLQAALARAKQDTTAAAAPDVERQQQVVRMNMQRWRWMPRDLGDTHILVNVPGYMMQVVEHGTPTIAMRVIVGSHDNPTPLFSDEMTYVVFSPYWNIPEKIIKEETLPRIARDPDYLRRNNIEVVATSGRADDAPDLEAIDWSDPQATKGLRFRQDPGDDNALGLVKFIFPNQFNVYLHDTPNDRLFNKPHRALSHGCVRIEQPMVLAQYVLRDRPEWTEPRITLAMASHTEQSVVLKKPLPVHIGYFTAWVASDGSVHYLDDPYGLDGKQMKLGN